MAKLKWTFVLLLAFAPAAGAAEAEPSSPSLAVGPGAAGSSEPFSTKDIFGFTAGSDVGEKGDRSIEFETSAALRKGGQHSTLEQEIAIEGVPASDFAYELSAHGLVSPLEAIDHRNALERMQFSGFSADLRYRLLARGTEFPVGLTIGIEPEWSRIDYGTDDRATGFSNAFNLFVDTVLVPDRIYAALNLRYDPQFSKVAGAGGWGKESSLGLSLAIASRLSPKLIIGGELAYDRDHEGLFLNRYVGEAVYVGPSARIAVTDRAALGIALAARIGFHAEAGATSGFSDFERYRARIKLDVDF